MKRVLLCWTAALWLTASCATAPPAPEKGREAVAGPEEISTPAPAPPAKPAAPLPVPKPVPPVKPPQVPAADDRSGLLLEGAALLTVPGEPDWEKARSIFLSLIREASGSRWRPAAEAFVRLIDERKTLDERRRQDGLRADQSGEERLKLAQENERLKKAAKETAEKLQTEIASLKQENEQLKRDIQRLKALEIELQQRERMLR